jgi:hypothetical protein
MGKRRVFTARSNRVSGVTNLRNQPGNLKLRAIAHKNVLKCENIEFSRRAQIVYQGSQTVEIGLEP